MKRKEIVLKISFFFFFFFFNVPKKIFDDQKQSYKLVDTRLHAMQMLYFSVGSEEFDTDCKELPSTKID